MIGATQFTRFARFSRRPARLGACVALLLSSSAAAVAFGAAHPDGAAAASGTSRTPRASSASGTSGTGRIAFAGTGHRSLARVTGAASTAPLFGAGPQHFDTDPSARGGRLVFTSLRDSTEPQVYLRDRDGGVHRLTTGMDAADPVLTPDGKTVVFDAAEPGGADGGTQRDLWLVGTDGTGLRRLTDTAADETSPTVSPDGLWVAYACDGDPPHSQIFRIPLVGGPSVRITDVPSGNAVDPAWNPVDDATHDKQLVYTWDEGGGTGPRLRITTPTGTDDRSFFASTGSGWRTGSASWLPDGSGVLFVSPDRVDGAATAYQNLYRAPTCSCTAPQSLLSENVAIATPTWLGDQATGGPVVDVNNAGPPNVADLEDVRRDGVDPRDLGVSVLTEDPAADTNTDPSKDPLFDPAPGYDPWTERQSYTPDGRHIVVTRFEDSAAGRVERIWLVDDDGSDPRRLHLDGRAPRDWDTDPAISPNGRLIAFTRTSPGGVGAASGPGRVVIADVATGAVVGTVEPPAGQAGASDAQPAWSSDGRLIAFTRTETIDGQGGDKHVWIVHADALTRQTDLSSRVCPGDCAVIDDSPAFSPDGATVAFNRKDGDGRVTERDGVLVTPVSGTGCEVVLPTGLTGDRDACGQRLPDTSLTGPFQPRDVAWTADASHLILTSRRALPPDSPEELERYDIATGELTPIDGRLPGRQKEPAVQASVDLALSAPAAVPTVHTGSSTTIGVTVTNHGPAPSPDTTFTVSAPAGARLTALRTPTGTCHAASLQCGLGTLAPGASVRLTATVTGTVVGRQPFGWSVDGAVVDPDPGDNAGRTVVPVDAAPPSGLSPPALRSGPGVAVSAQPDPGYVGGRVTVTYTVRNGPTSLATGLRLSLGLPAAVPTGTMPAGCTAGVCLVGDLDPGGSTVLRVVLAPKTALSTTVTARLTTSGTDAAPGARVARTPLRVLQPRITAVPPIGKPGFVTSVRGEDFPPGAPVRFVWTPGITAAAAPTVPAADGTFAGQLLILPKDRTGPRTITASGPGFSPVTTPFLVVSGGIGPPDEVERR